MLPTEHPEPVCDTDVAFIQTVPSAAGGRASSCCQPQPLLCPKPGATAPPGQTPLFQNGGALRSLSPALSHNHSSSSHQVPSWRSGRGQQDRAGRPPRGNWTPGSRDSVQDLGVIPGKPLNIRSRCDAVGNRAKAIGDDGGIFLVFQWFACRVWDSVSLGAVGLTRWRWWER